MSIFAFAQNLSHWTTYHFFALPEGSYAAEALNFFIYDVIKIGLLLIGINYLMAITRYYLPVEKVRDILTKRRWYGLNYLLAALLGVITPFCSCSSIPLFIGFLSAGIPLGVTFSFLISSPLVNEASLYVFPTIFGWETTLLYNFVGVVISVLGGFTIQKLSLEKYIQPEFLAITKNIKSTQEKIDKQRPNWPLLKMWTQEALSISKKILPFVFIGVGLGALIHGFVPQNYIEERLAGNNILSVPLAAILGIPLYANSVSIVPIMEALIGKGIPLGTALSFMTATVALSLPEALMLKKVLRWQLLAVFFGIVLLGILLIGYLFNSLAL